MANYCKKLADEFIPELVETLASEMNPDTVCTVAGKCFLHWHRHRSLPIPEIINFYNVCSLVIPMNVIFLFESLM